MSASAETASSLAVAVIVHHGGEELLRRGRRVAYSVGPGVYGALYAVLLPAAGGDDGHVGEVSADCAHDVRGAGCGRDVQDAGPRLKPCADVGLFTDYGHDQGNVYVVGNALYVLIAYGRVHDYAHGALGLRVPGQLQGAYALGGASADAAEHGQGGVAQHGGGYGRLRRKGIDRQHGVGVAVAYDGYVRRDNKEYEAAKEMILSGAKKGFNTVSLYNGDKAVQLYVTVCPYVL